MKKIPIKILKGIAEKIAKLPDCGTVVTVVGHENLYYKLPWFRATVIRVGADDIDDPTDVCFILSGPDERILIYHPDESAPQWEIKDHEGSHEVFVAY